MYRRIVVKLGTNLLTGGSSRLDAPLMSALVSQVSRLHEQGSEVLLVSSGAVAAGREVLGELGVRIPSLDKTKIS
ncbi:MAG: glutamate 5-kinase, partial [SAR202 cluster bacterium]|nr:glutamate 5-kinase [SAR202 cluster bacterium]